MPLSHSPAPTAGNSHCIFLIFARAARAGEEFTSDLPLRYRFTARVEDPPHGFAVALDDVQRTAAYDSQGNRLGNFPQEEVAPGEFRFAEFLSEGTLPAGEHRFSIEALGGSTRSGGAFSAGSAEFEVVAVPLPPAAWAALSAMGAMGAGQALRRRFAPARR